MFRHSLRTASLSASVLLVIGLGAGLALSDHRGEGALHGALLGLALAIPLGVHLVLRTLTGRTPESRTIELDPQSFERQILERAAARAFADMVSLSMLGSVVAFSLDDLTTVKLVLPVVLVFTAIDFLVRTLRGLRRGLSAS